MYKFLPPKNCLLCYYKLQLQEPANMDPNIILELRAQKKKYGTIFCKFWDFKNPYVKTTYPHVSYVIICVNKKSLDFSRHLRAQSWLWRKAKIQHALGQARSREDVPDVRILLLLGKGKQFKKATKKKQVTQSVLLLCFTCLCLWLSAALMISFLRMSSEFWKGSPILKTSINQDDDPMTSF